MDRDDESHRARAPVRIWRPCARAPNRRPDGSYRVFGQKIFITYGEHDMADNIVHLVLARTPTAPEGVKGISLFIVPKFIVNADGSLGERNDAGVCRSSTSSVSTRARRR
jgi:Acyl-CoA dehydrogenases